MSRNKFTLVELLIVVVIIGVLATVLGNAVQGMILRAQKEQARVVLNGLKIQISRYNSTYGRVPEKLEWLLEENKKNPRGIKFYDGNEIPKDTFDEGEDMKMITRVKKVEKDGEGNLIDIETHSKSLGVVVYSIGPNGEPDGNGSVEGGLYGPGSDGEIGTEDDLDDIAIFISL